MKSFVVTMMTLGITFVNSNAFALSEIPDSVESQCSDVMVYKSLYTCQEIITNLGASSSCLTICEITPENPPVTVPISPDDRPIYNEKPIFTSPDTDPFPKDFEPNIDRLIPQPNIDTLPVGGNLNF
jgi:hypothetical protein